MCEEIEKSNPELFSSSKKGIPQVDHHSILHALSSNAERLRKIKSLSDLYFPLFDKKIAELGMNSDYRYLPLLLSGLNSSFTGDTDRSGLWQLDYLTSRKFGVEISEEVDFRNAPDRSTDVALAYLQLLENRYNDHDKVLLAFYRSIAFVEKHSEQETLVDLDQESSDFLKIMRELPAWWEQLEMENSLFAYIEFLNTHENVVFDEEVSFYSLSKVLAIPQNELRQGNPVFVGNTIPANFRDQPFILRKDKMSEFESLKDSIYSFEEREKQRQAALAEKQRKELSSNIPAGATEHTYKVRSGDVLGSIAQKFGVRVSDIRNWNGLSGDRIYAGQKLVVYRKKGTAEKKESTSEQSSKNEESDQRESIPVQGEGKKVDYTVKSGESLWLIAKKFPGVSAENIMQWNAIDDDIQPGQKLVIFLKD